MAGFIRTRRSSSPAGRVSKDKGSPTADVSGVMGFQGVWVVVCILVVLVLTVALSPSCLGMGQLLGLGSDSHLSVINQSTADEINRLVMKFEKIHVPQDKSQAESSVASVFASANTAFKYHMQQRAASFIRDKVGPEDKLRWTEAKMREIFLVPVYSCPTEIRVGEWGEGGKWLCNIFPFRHALRNDGSASSDSRTPPTSPYPMRLDWHRAPVVYSVGSRDESSFEEAVQKLLNVEPFTMDPSLSEEKQKHLKSLPYIHFMNLGLTGKSGKQGPKKWGPLKRLGEVMKDLNHTYIDVLKIDCESCEIDVMNDMLEQYGRQPPIGQVLMEIHHVFLPKVELDLLLVMEKLGYRMFHSENNERYLKAHEVAYIHESLVDPALWPRDIAASR